MLSMTACFRKLAIASTVAGLMSGCALQQAAVQVVNHAVTNAVTGSERSLMPTAASQVDVATLLPDVPDTTLDAMQALVSSATPLASIGKGASEPGLVVLEPAASGTDPGAEAGVRKPDPGLRDFGRGAATWIDFTAAGVPAFGQSPQIVTIDRVENELGVRGNAVSPAHAQDLGRRVGATHVAIGSLQGVAGSCTLTYQVYRVGDLRPVGSPIAIQGTQAQVAAALPSLAQRIDRVIAPNINVAPSAVPAPADLALIGRARHDSWDSVPPADMAGLKRLSLSAPVAGMMYLQTCDLPTLTEVDHVALAVLTGSADNTIAAGELSRLSALNLVGMSTRIDGDFQKYPRNAQYALIETKLHRADVQPVKERRAAEAVVNDAPNNAESWLTLGMTISDEANNVRQGRTSDNITASESAFIYALYPDWEQCIQNSVSIDPLYGHAWRQLAEAATFNSDGTLADRALTKALKYDPDHSEVYTWGLQMYQDKWYPDPTKLQHIASLAVADQSLTCPSVINIASTLKDSGDTADSQALMTRYEQSQQAAVATIPGWAYWRLAACAAADGNTAHARAQYRLAEQSLPAYPALRVEAGENLRVLGDFVGASKEFAAAIALDPLRAVAHYDNGWVLKEMGKTAAAQQEFLAALKIVPSYGDAHYGLGEAYDMMHNNAAAASEFALAVKYGGPTREGCEFLAQMDDATHQYKQGLAVGRMALPLYPDDTDLVGTLADIYLNLNDGKGAIRLSQYAISVNPRDALGHENLAEGYRELGDISHARDEWKTVVSLGDPIITPVAQKFLAQYGG